MSDNHSSYQKVIKIIEDYCRGEVETLTKFIKSRDTVNPIDYYYGERNAYNLIISIIEDHSSPTTTKEEKIE